MPVVTNVPTTVNEVFRLWREGIELDDDERIELHVREEEFRDGWVLILRQWWIGPDGLPLRGEDTERAATYTISGLAMGEASMRRSGLFELFLLNSFDGMLRTLRAPPRPARAPSRIEQYRRFTLSDPADARNFDIGDKVVVSSAPKKKPKPRPVYKTRFERINERLAS